MRVVSFNVNSIRQRPHQLEAVAKTKPAVIGLQETKVIDEQFPLEMVRELGYEPFYHGQKTHYGVAMLVDQALVAADPSIATSVTKGFASDTPESQRRFIGLTVKGVRIWNGYFPQLIALS